MFLAVSPLTNTYPPYYTTIVIVAIILPGLFALVGLVLLFRGWRGRKLNDHQFCRKCRYNLHGCPDADSCPECGADLTHKRGIRLGERKRRPSMAVAGIVLLVFGAACGELIYLASNSDIDWNDYKPKCA